MENAARLSSEGRLFFQKHINKSCQLSLVLCPTRIVLGKLRKFVCQDAHSYVLRNVNSALRQRQLPTRLVAASARPALPFGTLVCFSLSARNRTQFIDLNLGPSLVPGDVHPPYSEVIEHNQRSSRLKEVTLTEAQVRVCAPLKEVGGHLIGFGVNGIHYRNTSNGRVCLTCRNSGREAGIA